MIEWPGRAFLDGDAEEPVSGVEGGFDHPVQLEIGLDFGLVDIVFRLTDLFGVIAPVPRREREIAAFLGGGGA